LREESEELRNPVTENSRRTLGFGSGQLLRALAAAVVLILLFALLPGWLGIEYQYMVSPEQFNGQGFARSFWAGTHVRIVETPKPLWSLFWLLLPRSGWSYSVIAVLFGLLGVLMLRISVQLTDSLLPGACALLVTVTGIKVLPELLLAGSWTLPNMILGLLLISAVLDERWALASVLTLLLGLLRPENWVFAPVVAALGSRRQRFGRWYLVIPFLAPLLWALYDFRMSGDPFFSYGVTASYAMFTGLEGTDFAGFWPRLAPEIVYNLGYVILGYGLFGLILRMVNRVRAADRNRFRTVVLDPLLAVAIYPILLSWLASLLGSTVAMCRFFFLSIAGLILAGALLPFELARLLPQPALRKASLVLLLPLVVAALGRAPAVVRDTSQSLQAMKTGQLAVRGLAESVKNTVRDWDSYRFVFIPTRRYGYFRALLGDEIARKFISYREVSFALAADDEERAQCRDTLLSRPRQLRAFLPALALWVPNDEIHYLTMFAFDNPELEGKSYTIGNDTSGVYGFRLLGKSSAGGELAHEGTFYDVRELIQGDTTRKSEY
jgi:hypothetical protein